MGIFSDWKDEQDQWDRDHCEVYATNRIPDLSDLPVFKPFYRCACGRETLDDDIEITDDDRLCCPCGSTDIEFVDTEE